MEKAKLEISREDAQDLAYDDHDGSIYEVVVNKTIDTTRWSIIRELVIKTLSDGRYWKDTYSIGATESQDETAFEYSDPEFLEVFPTTVETVVYK